MMSGTVTSAKMTWTGWNTNEISVPTQMTKKIVSVQNKKRYHLF